MSSLAGLRASASSLVLATKGSDLLKAREAPSSSRSPYKQTKVSFEVYLDKVVQRVVPPKLRRGPWLPSVTAVADDR